MGHNYSPKGYKYKGLTTSLGKLFGHSTIYGRAEEHDTPYMLRVWIGRLRLHVFYRGDQDKDCHDHPWDFWTFPFTSYVEEVVEPSMAKAVQNSEAFIRDSKRVPGIHQQVVKAWRLHFRPSTHCHRVLGRFSGKYEGGVPQVDQRKVVTLVVRSGVERKWGFLKNRDGKWCWTPWKDYVFGGGKDAPCSK